MAFPLKVRCHDPRVSNNRADKSETSNPTLIAAELATQRGDIVDWESVAEWADYCDLPAET